MSISAFGDKVPRFGPGVFIHPDATVIGDVVLEEGASVWPGAVLRGDVERITVGAFTSFQDGAVAHCDPGYPVVLGPGCAVGHGSVVHGAVVGAGSLLGMRSILLTGCAIGEESIVGAGSLVPKGRAYPPRSLLVGSPARLVRVLSDEDVEPILALRERYARRGARYAELGLAADLSAFRR
jgi:carbonic anhydrase/acetyltransferase-like protein (isoleucine patch superfamily)